MNLQEVIQKYIKSGYSDELASSKVSQDLILTAIANSKYNQNITIKGGVVMHNLSNDKRRATRDLDLYFIKYSLDDKSINYINFEIIDEIIPLHHQDYKGKRVFLKIKDNYKNEIGTKLDIGVHKLFQLEQEQYMFDFYYLIDNELLNKEKLEKCFKILIYDDKSINVNNVKDLISQFEKITSSRLYKINLNNPKYNWLDKNIDGVIDKIKDYLVNMETVTI